SDDPRWGSPTSLDETHPRESHRGGEPLTDELTPGALGAEVAHQLEAVSASDRKFFEQQPRREFRLRPAWAVEVADFARHGMDPALPDGACWWVAVHRVHEKLRQRTPFGAPHWLPTQSSEAEARRMWHRVCPPRWKELVRWARERGTS